MRARFCACKKQMSRSETCIGIEQAAREAAAYEGGESFKGDSKTPKTRKKAVLTRDGAVDEKGAITTFFSRRPAEMEEDGDGFVQGRRRLRQRGDSDDDESDEDSEAGSVEETTADIEREEAESALAGAGEKIKGVMGMAFMQRSMGKQREEAAKLLEDLKQMEEGGGLSDDSDYDLSLIHI